MRNLFQDVNIGKWIELSDGFPQSVVERLFLNMSIKSAVM